uniref:Secreted protein n=1 Tax=Rhizophora mucronata TaxID=61149 RepID=A0A2P2PN24_RHIMU
MYGTHENSSVLLFFTTLVKVNVGAAYCNRQAALPNTPSARRSIPICFVFQEQKCSQKKTNNREVSLPNN